MEKLGKRDGVGENRVLCFCCEKYKKRQWCEHYANDLVYVFRSLHFQALEQMQVKRLTNPIRTVRGPQPIGLKKTIP
ncbi:hypothetical protein M1E08_04010 [Erwinia sp. PK3-005]|uniref:SWIM-type domain-containing protein n=1 Tax=Mixta hanseatica TaxID=2872648 RepID=A0ABY4R5W8_9GAMM|nr:hypothetical protein [Mixta hanseatica]UQY43439.1 hypothetical protein K6958_16425 [Mixta hanseatica]